MRRFDEQIWLLRWNACMNVGDDIEFYDEWWKDHFKTEESRLKSTVRHQFFKDELQEKNAPILVVGCGGVDEMSIVQGGSLAVGMDISFTAVKQSKQQYPEYSYLVADATHLPFATSSFQTLVCSEVIEHIRKADSALADIYRVLRSKGWLLLSTPNWLSFYGLARYLARLIFSVDLTSGNQPYDDWSTKNELRRKLELHQFSTKEWYGLWYFPPFGKGEKLRIPDWIVVPLVKFLLPLDALLGSILPAFGHIIVVVAKK